MRRIRVLHLSGLHDVNGRSADHRAGQQPGRHLDSVQINGNNCTTQNVAPNAAITCTATYPTLAGGTVGNTFPQVNINMTYTDATSGLPHTDTGFVQGKY